MAGAGIEIRNVLKFPEAEAIVQEEVSNELMALGEQLSGLMQTNIRNKGGIASGTMVSTTNPAKVGESIQVGSPVEYGAYYEFGTKPHWPPYDPIRQWVEMKKGSFTTLAIGVSFESGRAVPTRRGTLRVPKSREARILDSIARAIQRKIAMRGTQGRYVMRDSLNQLGVKYEVVSDVDGVVYQVDVADFLNSVADQLWKRIENRLKN